MDPNNNRWSHFGVAMFLKKNHHVVQCLVGYGSAHGFESLVQALGKVLQQWLVIYLCWWVHEGDKIGGNLDYGICGRWKNLLDLDFHEKKISK